MASACPDSSDALYNYEVEEEGKTLGTCVPCAVEGCGKCLKDASKCAVLEECEGDCYECLPGFGATGGDPGSCTPCVDPDCGVCNDDPASCDSPALRCPSDGAVEPATEAKQVRWAGPYCTASPGRQGPYERNITAAIKDGACLNCVADIEESGDAQAFTVCDAVDVARQVAAAAFAASPAADGCVLAEDLELTLSALCYGPYGNYPIGEHNLVIVFDARLCGAAKTVAAIGSTIVDVDRSTGFLKPTEVSAPRKWTWAAKDVAAPPATPTSSPPAKPTSSPTAPAPPPPSAAARLATATAATVVLALGALLF
jgi:hypothetical protein